MQSNLNLECGQLYVEEVCVLRGQVTGEFDLVSKDRIWGREEPRWKMNMSYLGGKGEQQSSGQKKPRWLSRYWAALPGSVAHIWLILKSQGCFPSSTSPIELCHVLNMNSFVFYLTSFGSFSQQPLMTAMCCIGILKWKHIITANIPRATIYWAPTWDLGRPVCDFQLRAVAWVRNFLSLRFSS